jgi:hypothetical protein
MATGSHDSALRLHRLAFHEEDGEVVVGRPDVDSFAVLPPDGAALLRQLAQGQPPAAAALWYAETFHEDVDIAQFVATLRELRFMHDDEEPLAGHAAVRWQRLRRALSPPARHAAVRWQRLGRALFSAPAWAGYTVLLLAAVVVCVRNPDLQPRPRHVIFSNYLLVVAGTVAGGQLVLTAFHEMFHALAARRLGVRSSVRMSRRFYFIVFETNLDGLVVLPRRQRVLPILAGLVADTTAFSALTVTAALTDGAEHRAISDVCLALAFTVVPRIAWQFYVFLRTDIYYLVTTLTGATDLDAASRAQLSNIVNRLRRHPMRHDMSAFHPRDQRAARWFAPLLVVGYGAMSSMFVLTLPVLWRLLSSSAQRVFVTHQAHPAGTWDAGIFGALVLAQFAFAAVLRLKRHQERRKDRA